MQQAVEYVDVDGLRIAYRRSGSGPPLLLLHGGVCDSRVWRVELDTLSDEFTVVAWDAPGCGGSSDPPESYRLPEYAGALSALVDALDLGPVHVLGHSFGSGLALELYRRRPDLVSSLVLASAYAGWAGSLAPEEVDARLQFVLRAAELLPTSTPGIFSDALPSNRVEELTRIMSDIRPVATRAMAYAFAEADLRDMLGDIDVPVLILAGGADERSPLSVADALHASIPGSRLVVLPGLGHEMFFEDAEPCDDAVRAFLHDLVS